MGPFPITIQQLKFLVVGKDYFTKWVKAEALATIMEKNIRSFIQKNIIRRYGIPKVLVSDHGKQFDNNSFKIFSHNWESRTTTPLSPTHKPKGKSKSRTDPCLKSSRLSSRGQRVYGQRKHRFDQLMEARQSSQQKSDSRATEWVIMMKERTIRLCVYSLIYQTKSG